MTARRFTLMAEGLEPLHIIVCSSAGEADALMASGLVSVDAPLVTQPAEQQPRGPGRPSCERVLHAAIADLGARFNRHASRIARARQLRDHLVQVGVEEPPAVRTIEDFLRAHEKSHGNSARGRKRPRRT